MGITAPQLAALKKELTSLKLEKYIEEIALTIAESTFKTSADILAAAEISSMLHQRFDGFSSLLVSTLVGQIGPPPPPEKVVSEQREKDEAARLSRQRSALRMITELYIISIATDDPKAKEGLIPTLLNELVSSLNKV
jgi:regulator of nonsense transcripts 2